MTQTISFAKLSVSTLIVLAITGCGHKVIMKDGQPANNRAYQADRLACERDAATTYPFAQVIQTSGGGYSGTSETTCMNLAGFLNCSSTPSIYTAPTTTTIDGNSAARNDYLSACLESKGYYSVFVSNRGPSAAAATTHVAQPTRQPASKTVVRSRNATSSFAIGPSGFSHYYNPAEWSIDLSTAGKPLFTHVSGTGYAVIVYESISAPQDQLVELAIMNAKKVASNVQLGSQSIHLVNGSEITVAEYTATIEGQQLSYLNYYFSSSRGTVQVLTFTSKELSMQVRPILDEFLSGLAVFN